MDALLYREPLFWVAAAVAVLLFLAAFAVTERRDRVREVKQYREALRRHYVDIGPGQGSLWWAQCDACPFLSIEHDRTAANAAAGEHERQTNTT